MIDGSAVEGNPFTGHYRRDQVHHIAASATGFEPKTQDVALANDLVVTLSLDKRSPAAPTVRTASARRTNWSRRAAQMLTPETDVASEPVGARAAIVRPGATPSASPAAGDPAGGHAPVHPIQTISPYEAP